MAMKNILVADVMTRTPITLKPDTNLLECAKKMVRKRVGSLPITIKKRLIGFISEKDILWALIKKSKEDLSKIKVIDISPKKIATTKPFATIEQAIEKMKKLKFDKLPVIHNNKLMGIITVRDILNFNPKIYPELDEFAKVKEEQEKLKRVKTRKVVQRGECEKCGNFNILRNVNESMICNQCENLM